ncbi:MAG: hypothetical protein FWH11_07955 [Micrococcales bacterium]|nr:hypothetical protein [Micrococcales bacterium]
MSEQVGCRRARRAEARSDEGAATIEYVGMIIAVAVLLVSVIGLFTPMGNDLNRALCGAVGKVVGDSSCAGAGAGAGEDTAGSDLPEKAPPKGPYTTHSDETKIDAGLSISFVDIGGGIVAATEGLSNGTYKVTFVDKARVGVSLSAGEMKAKLKVGDYGGSLGASASFSKAFEGAYAVEYTLNSAQEVADLKEWAAREYGKDVVKTVGGPLNGLNVELISWLVDKIDGYDYKPPEPSAIFAEGSVVIGGKAMAGGILAGGNVEVSGSKGLGARLEPNGNITVYTKTTLDAKVASDLGLVKFTNGSVGTEVVISVTVDKNHDITEVGLSGAATAEGSYNLFMLTGTPSVGSGGKGIGINATFPVTDANRADTIAALARLGVANTVGGTAVSQAAAVPWIMDQARTNGDVSAQTYDVAADNIVNAALGLKAPALGGVGMELDASRTSKTSTGAWYLGRNNTWVEW